jgi:hypothetical protein
LFCFVLLRFFLCFLADSQSFTFTFMSRFSKSAAGGADDLKKQLRIKSGSVKRCVLMFPIPRFHPNTKCVICVLLLLSQSVTGAQDVRHREEAVRGEARSLDGGRIRRSRSQESGIVFSPHFSFLVMTTSTHPSFSAFEQTDLVHESTQVFATTRTNVLAAHEALSTFLSQNSSHADLAGTPELAAAQEILAKADEMLAA